MKQTRQSLFTAYVILILLLCFPTTVYAYFDPGTGSMLLQMLGIAFITMGGVFVAFKNRIFALFRKNNGSPEDENLHDIENGDSDEL